MEMRGGLRGGYVTLCYRQRRYLVFSATVKFIWQYAKLIIILGGTSLFMMAENRLSHPQ